MKNWIKSNLRKPPQGKKVLCFNNGDIDVRQRFKDYWFPIPYLDSQLANLDAPEYWQEIDFPLGYFGFMKVMNEGKKLNMDEFEKAYPENFNGMVQDMINHFNETRN